jgi:hypothetical protein
MRQRRHAAPQSGTACDGGRFELNRGGEAEVIERRRAQIVRDAPHGSGRDLDDSD